MISLHTHLSTLATSLDYESKTTYELQSVVVSSHMQEYVARRNILIVVDLSLPVSAVSCKNYI